MKLLLIEDERLSADRLSHLLQECNTPIEVIIRIDSIKKAVSWLRSNKTPDLIFLDIQLGDGICFEIFDEVRVSSPIIFTTAYNEYAIRAFKVNSIDYLLKPIKLAELQAALAKYYSLKANLTVSNPTIITPSEELAQQFKTRFLIRVGSRMISILIDEVSYFYSQESITFLLTQDHKKYIIDYSLDKIENLVSPVHFFRVNRKYLINYSSVSHITDYTNNRLQVNLKMFDTETIVVSRERVQSFKDWLDL
jgi:DNA-binding LytR/AlgR family response regulator